LKRDETAKALKEHFYPIWFSNWGCKSSIFFTSLSCFHTHIHPFNLFFLSSTLLSFFLLSLSLFLLQRRMQINGKSMWNYVKFIQTQLDAYHKSLRENPVNFKDLFNPSAEPFGEKQVTTFIFSSLTLSLSLFLCVSHSMVKIYVRKCNFTWNWINLSILISFVLSFSSRGDLCMYLSLFLSLSLTLLLISRSLSLSLTLVAPLDHRVHVIYVCVKEE
jgi:hypothetical protein